jgi:hypothetical protein
MGSVLLWIEPGSEKNKAWRREERSVAMQTAQRKAREKKTRWARCVRAAALRKGNPREGHSTVNKDWRETEREMSRSGLSENMCRCKKRDGSERDN